MQPNRKDLEFLQQETLRKIFVDKNLVAASLRVCSSSENVQLTKECTRRLRWKQICLALTSWLRSGRELFFAKQTKKATLKTWKQGIHLKLLSADDRCRCSVKFLMTCCFSSTKRTVTFQLVQLPVSCLSQQLTSKIQPISFFRDTSTDWRQRYCTRKCLISKTGQLAFSGFLAGGKIKFKTLIYKKKKDFETSSNREVNPNRSCRQSARNRFVSVRLAESNFSSSDYWLISSLFHVASNEVGASLIHLLQDYFELIRLHLLVDV